ncbi:MAG: hypothetical protein J07HQX50_00737 [Haloquadratum sp. J07HQX50]|nr:MAG: hypothetical protein J07HQX50_00737 [Haloquadratum sp. J07HQX50]
MEEWLDGCNITSDLAWETEHTQAGVRNVAKETKLNSQHSILACHEVASRIQSCIERAKKTGRKRHDHNSRPSPSRTIGEHSLCSVRRATVTDSAGQPLTSEARPRASECG